MWRKARLAQRRTAAEAAVSNVEEMERLQSLLAQTHAEQEVQAESSVVDAFEKPTAMGDTPTLRWESSVVTAKLRLQVDK